MAGRVCGPGAPGFERPLVVHWRMAHPLSPLCVYCGAAWGARPEFKSAATGLGRAMAARGIDLVYGGGKLGLMREVADAVMTGGGHVLGVITHDLKHKEVAHNGLSRLEVVETMHQRKKLMADKAKGFVAMPGGVGTMDELFEILAWAQLGIHERPVGLLNTAGFFDGLLGFIRHMADEGFLRVDPARMLAVADTPEALLDALERYEPLTRRAYDQTPVRAG